MDEDAPYETLTVEERCGSLSFKTRRYNLEKLMKKLRGIEEDSPEWNKYLDIINWNN